MAPTVSNMAFRLFVLSSFFCIYVFLASFTAVRLNDVQVGWAHLNCSFVILHCLILQYWFTRLLIYHSAGLTAEVESSWTKTRRRHVDWSHFLGPNLIGNFVCGANTTSSTFQEWTRGYYWLSHGNKIWISEALDAFCDFERPRPIFKSSTSSNSIFLIEIQVLSFSARVSVPREVSLSLKEAK